MRGGIPKGDFTDEHVDLATDAAGSKDLGETDTLAVMSAAHAIRQRGPTVVDIVAALDECGYFDVAERTVAFARARLSGEYLQTSAIFDEQLSVLSLEAPARANRSATVTRSRSAWRWTPRTSP